MDREISKEVQRKEQRKQFIRIGTAVGGFILHFSPLCHNLSLADRSFAA